MTRVEIPTEESAAPTKTRRRRATKKAAPAKSKASTLVTQAELDASPDVCLLVNSPNMTQYYPPIEVAVQVDNGGKKRVIGHQLWPERENIVPECIAALAMQEWPERVRIDTAWEGLADG